MSQRSFRSWLRRGAAVAASAGSIALVSAVRAGDLTVTPRTEPNRLEIAVDPSVRAGTALLQVFDAATGECLKTLHAGPLTDPQTFTLVSHAALPPGTYTLRLREGLRCAVDAEIERPDPAVPEWLNPTEVVLAGDAVYVLDAGYDARLSKPELLAYRTWAHGDGTSIEAYFLGINEGAVTLVVRYSGQHVIWDAEKLQPADRDVALALEATRQALEPERKAKLAAIFKMDRDGKPDPGFGDAGKLAFEHVNYHGLRSFAVDPDTGELFVASFGHHLDVYDRNGKRTERTVGGWEAPSESPRNTPSPHSIALGPGNRIYIPGGPYAYGKVYDRTKAGFDGFLYPFKLPECEGHDRYICADGRGSFYTVGRQDFVTKHADDGASVTIAYVTNASLKLARPTGGSASGGLVWWACHGPGFGPFWDSGGGGEVVLLWDAGSELRLVERFGVPGQGAGKLLQLLNPSTAVMNRQHTELWVVEDGQPNKEGPPGNARVRRLALQARHSEEMAITLIPK